ncbi:hypothetical protein ERO13_D05G371471v2, partial [Gossypium hirsutum]
RRSLEDCSALTAYEQSPENVSSHLNYHVTRVLEKTMYNQPLEFKDVITNSTRRSLRGKHKNTSPCMTINPIDRCWRCKKNSKNRKRLSKCVLGFGHKIQGGNKGEYYLVADNSDDDVVNPKPRTLRHAVIQKRPLWIIFAPDMNIKLSQELMVKSHKAIDMETLKIIMAIAQLAMEMGFPYLDHQGFSLIIFSCLSVRTDTLMQYKVPLPLPFQIAISPHHDHVSFILKYSTCYTFCNLVILLSASDTYSKDQYIQVTLAFNHFGKELIQKMPRCRWGYFHVVNNNYTLWKLYAIGGSMHPIIISQGNKFIALDDPLTKEVNENITN